MRKVVSIAGVVIILSWLLFHTEPSSVAQPGGSPAKSKKSFTGDAVFVETISRSPLTTGYEFLQKPRIIMLGGRSFLVGSPVRNEQEWTKPTNNAKRVWVQLSEVRSILEFETVEHMRKEFPQLIEDNAAAKKPPHIKGLGDIIDPDKDCRVSVSNGTVTMTIPGKHHDLTYTDDYTKLNSPRILQPVEGDFRLLLRVPAYPLPGDAASSGGRHSFVSTGVLIWQDDKNFIRLERTAVAQAPAPFVWFERFKDGKSVGGEMKPITNTDTGFQVVRKGNQFTFSYQDGAENKGWTEVQSEAIETPAKLQVGMTAINSTAKEFAARVTGLEVGTKK